MNEILAYVVSSHGSEPCLPGDEPASFDPAQTAYTGSTDGGSAADARDRRNADPERLSPPRICDVEARRLGSSRTLFADCIAKKALVLRTKLPRRRNFVHDQLSSGQKFRVLTVTEVFSREAWPSR